VINFVVAVFLKGRLKVVQLTLRRVIWAVDVEDEEVLSSWLL